MEKKYKKKLCFNTKNTSDLNSSLMTVLKLSFKIDTYDWYFVTRTCGLKVINNETDDNQLFASSFYTQSLFSMKYSNSIFFVHTPNRFFSFQKKKRTNDYKRFNINCLKRIKYKRIQNSTVTLSWWLYNQ